MGTNFYLHEPPCPTCSRREVVHVGKSSAGWSFGFRGYRHDPDDGPVSPLGRPVRSRADWREVFADKEWQLIDEYDREVVDPLGWLAERQPPSVEQQGWERAHMGAYWRPSEYDWRDAEGFRFYGGEFS